MIVPQVFYRGCPLNGAASTSSTSEIKVFDVLAQVPAWKKWRIEEIVVTNMTVIEGFYSVAIFPDTVTSITPQPNPGSLFFPTTAGLLPYSNAGPSLGSYLAFSQSIPPLTTRVQPIVAWALSGEKLWVGAYPGGNILLGAGGVSVSISGREYRD